MSVTELQLSLQNKQDSNLQGLLPTIEHKVHSSPEVISHWWVQRKHHTPAIPTADYSVNSSFLFVLGLVHKSMNPLEFFHNSQRI